jgi:hypothetical protein
MASIQDAKGKLLPSWARFVENIAAGGSLAGYTDDGGAPMAFGLYLYDDSTVVFATVDDPDTDVTFTFGAGYHAIAFTSITSSSTAALALFPFKPSGA